MKTIKRANVKFKDFSDKTGSRITKEIRELYGVDHITIYHVSA